MSRKQGPAAVVFGAAGDIGAELVRLFADTGMPVWTIDHVEPVAAGDRFIEMDFLALRDSDVDRRAQDLPYEISNVVSTIGGPAIREFGEGFHIPRLSVLDEVMRLNLISAFQILRMTLPVLRRTQGDRSVTFTSSINELGGYGAPAYSAAKAGLRGLVAESGRALAPEGIRVNGVALGSTATSNAQAIRRARGLPGSVEDLGGRTARGAVLTAKEAAEALYSVSLGPQILSGQVVTCDYAQACRRP
jgi:NAD(P)-dependent dehydrogenase (short-subunit alcohol dehydrogenase family)